MQLTSKIFTTSCLSVLMSNEATQLAASSCPEEATRENAYQDYSDHGSDNFWQEPAVTLVEGRHASLLGFNG